MNNNQLTTKITTELIQALLKGDSDGVGEILDDAIDSGVSLEALYIEVIGSAQREIGEMWARGQATIAHEHRATQILFDQLSRIRQGARQRKKLGARVVVSSLQGDFHILGGRIVADLLHLDGWDVDFLGADTPVDELIRHVNEVKPDLVGISVSHEDFYPKLLEAIQKLIQCPSKPKILVGGRGVSNKVEELKKFGSKVFVSNGSSATEQARRMTGLNGSANSLAQVLGELGSRIHYLRKSQKISQEKLAKLSGLDRAYISSVENGKQNITIGALLKLSDALGVDLRDIISGPLQ